MSGSGFVWKDPFAGDPYRVVRWEDDGHPFGWRVLVAAPGTFATAVEAQREADRLNRVDEAKEGV